MLFGPRSLHWCTKTGLIQLEVRHVMEDVTERWQRKCDPVFGKHAFKLITARMLETAGSPRRDLCQNSHPRVKRFSFRIIVPPRQSIIIWVKCFSFRIIGPVSQSIMIWDNPIIIWVKCFSFRVIVPLSQSIIICVKCFSFRIIVPLNQSIISWAKHFSFRFILL